MTISDAQFTAWLQSQSATRCVLVEVNVGTAGGGNVTRYLSTRGFVSTPTDTPANTSYRARITGGIKYTRAISLDGSVSLSFGDIELANDDGSLDAWLYDYWANRPFTIYLGDVTWPRANFRPVFYGVTTGIDSRARTTINIKVSDRTQRFNAPVTVNTLGGSTALNAVLLPIVIGEAHNISPLLTNAATNEYLVSDPAYGPIEGIIEIRDNGIPVSATFNAATNKFTLNATPAGTVTASVQGVKMPMNLVYSTDTLVGSSGGGGVSNLAVTQGTVPAPYVGGPTANALVPDSTTNYHIFSAGFSVPVIGAVYTASMLVKQGPGSGSDAVLSLYAGSDGATYVNARLTFGTGLVSTADIGANFTSGGGVLKSAGAVNLGNGWWRMWLTAITSTSTASTTVVVYTTNATGAGYFTGDGSTVALYAAGLQVEGGVFPTSPLGAVAQTLNAPNYRNSVAELVRFAITNLGVASLQAQPSELDIPGLVLFDCLNRQPVGLFISDKANVLDSVNQLTSSIGARLVQSNNGLFTLTKLANQVAGSGTAIGQKDMLDKSLQLNQACPVVAAVNLGYCENWTVQTTLAGGVDSSSVALFQEQWLNAIVSDSGAAANYALSTDATQVDTLLVRGADATIEATRRLNMFNTQRVVLQYTGFAPLVGEQLGGAQTITNPRFGLAAGKTGQIISIAVDFTNLQVDFQVLI